MSRVQVRNVVCGRLAELLRVKVSKSNVVTPMRSADDVERRSGKRYVIKSNQIKFICDKNKHNVTHKKTKQVCRQDTKAA